MAHEIFHAGFVAEDAATGDAAGGVDGKHGEAVALVAEPAAEVFDEGTLAGAGHAGDAHTQRATGVGQQAGEELLGQRLMGRVVAFHQGDGPRKNAYIGRQHAMSVLVKAEIAASGGLMPSRGSPGRRNPCHHATGKLWVVLRSQRHPVGQHSPRSAGTIGLRGWAGGVAIGNAIHGMSKGFADEWKTL